MHAETAPPVPVGKFKSIGPIGPVYKVGNARHRLPDGDWMVEVTFVETGEQIEYRLSHIIDDPEAH